MSLKMLSWAQVQGGDLGRATQHGTGWAGVLLGPEGSWGRILAVTQALQEWAAIGGLGTPPQSRLGSEWCGTVFRALRQVP